MKYGESTFDILYLLFAAAAGIIILIRGRTRAEKLMGLASLLLGVGDAFHLVPRVLNYFVEADFTAALGVGKLITSLTMTLFYVLLYYIWLDVFGRREKRNVTIAVWGLVGARVLLCAFPQNGWTTNSSTLAWAVIRNVPFVLLGGILLVLWFYERMAYKRFRFMWLYILLSFLFYIPVTIGSSFVPLLGMLMLPKTVCYILMIVTFLLAVTKDRVRK